MNLQKKDEIFLAAKYPFIITSGNINAQEYCIIESRVHGMFACFYCILYGLYICETEQLKPVIFLGNIHLYYQKEYGENVFEYFYNQVHVPNVEDKGELLKITVNDPAIFLSWCRVSTTERSLSNFFINKYFKLNDETGRVIEEFRNSHFKGNRMLGVHYRGKDKIYETDLALFEEYDQKIDFLLGQKICDKIFFCTDELHLRDYVKNKYGNQAVLYTLKGNYNNVKEDEDTGLHFCAATPYFHGQDTLIECYLLSCCPVLMSSFHSSMSLFSTFINKQQAHIIIEP